MLCTPKPNGFADHYPYEKLLFHWEYTLFSDIPICECDDKPWLQLGIKGISALFYWFKKPRINHAILPVGVYCLAYQLATGVCV